MAWLPSSLPSKNGGRTPTTKAATSPVAVPSPPGRSRQGAGAALLALVLVAAVSVAVGGERADFYLIERPRELVICDRFQQTVHNPTAAGIVPFVPMRVLAWEDFMGDGFTPCTRVEVDGKTYFLIRDAESQRLVGEGRMGQGVIVRDAQVVDDTVALTRGRRIEFVPLPGGRPEHLAGGELLARLFRAQGRTYARLLETRSRFGWLTLAEERQGTDWVRAHATPVAPPAPVIDPLPRIQAAADEANAVLRSVYRLLNESTGRQRTPPRWEVTRSASQALCTLRGIGAAARYRETSAQLAKRIERQLLGTPYAVIVTPGSLLVVRR